MYRFLKIACNLATYYSFKIGAIKNKSENRFEQIALFIGNKFPVYDIVYRYTVYVILSLKHTAFVVLVSSFQLCKVQILEKRTINL